MIYFLP